jgi:endopeptidase La
METIRIAGYVFEEKMAIAKKYLIPQTEKTSGIGAQNLDLQEEALKKIIKEYAREAGVRNLRQLLDKVSRKVALTMVRAKTDESAEQTATIVTPENLSKYIGQPVHLSDRLFTGGMPAGVVMGLAWTSNGGATLCVEARGRLPDGTVRGGMAFPDISGVEPAKHEKPHSSSEGTGGSGHMQVTGQLGSVMSESSSISLTYSRLFARELDASESFLDDAKIHLHVPEGATPKDGPSAGVTMASALISLCLDEPLKAEVAMTGELTLTGKVLKVGGIKEKVIAARREGITTLLLPRSNEADYVELKEYLRAGLTAHFVDHFDDVYRLAFEESKVPLLPRPSRGLPVVTVVTPETFSAEKPDALAGSAAQDDGGDLQTPAQSSDLPGGITTPLRSPPLPSSPTAEASGLSS